MSYENDIKNQSFESSVVHRPKKLSSAFSPKDKLFLVCSPLGGYSLLDEKKYHISFMKPPTVSLQPPVNYKQTARRAIKSFDQTFTKVWPPAGTSPEGTAEVDWQKLNSMLASIADSGANALREFPWWSESHIDTAALVPFAFLYDQQKFDLTQLGSNHYFQNQRKIARLANRYGLTYIFSIYNASEKRVNRARYVSPWNGKNNIHNLANFFYGEDAAFLREAWEMQLIAAFADTDTLFELCNEPDPKAAVAMAQTYIRFIRNNIHPSRILTGWDIYRKEKEPVYADYYRQWRNAIVVELGEDFEQHIKKQSWSTIHKVSMDTLHAYWHHGLNPSKEIPANSSRNTIYSTDGVRNPRPALTGTQTTTEAIIDVKSKAAEAGRIGIEVVYGKESNVDPLDGIKGVAFGFRKKYNYFPCNYQKYPEPLPLPDWVFEEEPIPPVTIPEVPEDLARAFDQLKTPMLRLLEDKEAIDEVWPLVYPVLRKYRLV